MRGFRETPVMDPDLWDAPERLTGGELRSLEDVEWRPARRVEDGEDDR